MRKIARVAVLLPVDKSYDYLVPDTLVGAVAPGVRVWAPWGKRSVEGVVVEMDPADPPSELRRIDRLVDAARLPDDLLALARWVADFYLAPMGEVLRLCLPPGGQARLRRHLVTTERGRAAAAGQKAALVGTEAAEALAALRPRDRKALAQLADGKPPPVDCAEARALVVAGLAVIEEEVKVRGRRDEVLLRAARTPDDGELARAPRRLAAWQQIAAAIDGITLDALRAVDPAAAASVAPLVKAGLVERITRARRAGHTASGDAMPTLTAEQAAALGALTSALGGDAQTPFLLHGITGSGKTEVYLRAVAAAIESGRTALVLVPEISLTPQLAARFRARFGDRVAVLHSGLGNAERAAAHRRIAAGEAAVALGARSAVFAPLPRLGVVVIDEEHDPSFKQQEGVRYHARDVALRRARAAGAVAVLGSATPSLEAWSAAVAGRLTLLPLRERPTRQPLPTVEIIDLRKHKLPDSSLLSAPLCAAVEQTLATGDQAILFLNRRGFSTFVFCRSCGNACRCRDCAVTLTWHKGSDRLLCHYCGFATSPPTVCSSCGARAIERVGAGTEQAEAQISARFANARVGRLDRDTAAGKGLGRVLDKFRAGDLDLLVGTQMVTKGHDFPNVTLVGVLNADHGMGLPDFRAAERTFQLLEQVAGRAGRGDKPGRVVIQTYHPLHPAVTCARDHDYARFVELELAARAELSYPPSGRIACIHVDGADPMAVRELAEASASAARTLAQKAPSEAGAAVLGPSEAPLSRLKGRSRWQVFVKARTPHALRLLAKAALGPGSRSGARLSVDIDPMSLL